MKKSLSSNDACLHFKKGIFSFRLSARVHVFLQQKIYFVLLFVLVGAFCFPFPFLPHVQTTIATGKITEDNIVSPFNNSSRLQIIMLPFLSTRFGFVVVVVLMTGLLLSSSTVHAFAPVVRNRPTLTTSATRLHFGFLKELGIEKPSWLPDFGGKKDDDDAATAAAATDAAAAPAEGADSEDEEGAPPAAPKEEE